MARFSYRLNNRDGEYFLSEDMGIGDKIIILINSCRDANDCKKFRVSLNGELIITGYYSCRSCAITSYKQEKEIDPKIFKLIEQNLS